MQLRARVDFSILSAFSRCSLPFSTCFTAVSTLQSILSRIVPYSITSTLKSLKRTARELIESVSSLISLLRCYYYTTSMSSSCSSIYDSSRVGSTCVEGLSPCSSCTFRQWSFSILRSSNVAFFSLVARIDYMFLRTNENSGSRSDSLSQYKPVYLHYSLDAS